MNFHEKILSLKTLIPWRESLRQQGKKLVVTNGCFDLLHVGHITYLQTARNQGDALLVGLTSDAGVRELKGPGRPLNPETDRAALLAALESVSAVYVFPETTATLFLGLVQPDIYVKGGDYSLQTINQEERLLLEKLGAAVVLLPAVPGQSTTNLLKRISRLQG